MNKLKAIAEEIGQLVEVFIQGIHADIGVFVCSKNGAMGVFCGGKKGDFNERAIPFFKEAIKKLQQVVDAHESGQINLGQDKAAFQFNSQEKKFEPLDDGKPKDDDQTFMAN